MKALTAVPLPAAAYAAYRRQVIFAACKWDPQLGDTRLIGDQALVLSPAMARQLCTWAECLATETMHLEQAALARPDLHAGLGLPWALRRALARAVMRSPEPVRLMRFDLHPTEAGWALSEVNSDVPGGLGEAAVMSRLAADLIPRTQALADPAAAVAAAFAKRLPAGSVVALVHATAYADDQQVMAYLAGALLAQGLAPVLAAPDHLQWSGDRVLCLAGDRPAQVQGLIRFFPTEWLPALSRRNPWYRYFAPGVIACNPATAVLTQSKRLPLVWPGLGVAVPTWSALLPATVAPATGRWQADADWVLKPALGRVGEGIAIAGVTPKAEWRASRRGARWRPGVWVAQRRFTSCPVATSAGLRHACLGVYTVDGRAVGMYGRLSPWARIDARAQDVPVVVASDAAAVEEEGCDGQ